MPYTRPDTAEDRIYLTSERLRSRQHDINKNLGQMDMDNNTCEDTFKAKVNLMNVAIEQMLTDLSNYSFE